MPAAINLPSDFQAAAKTLRASPCYPAVLAFPQLVRAEIPWSPRLPRTGASAPCAALWPPLGTFDPHRLSLPAAAARRRGDLAIAQARRRRGDYIYDDGRDLLIFGGSEAPRQRLRTPDGFGRPMTYGSILDVGKPPPMMSAKPAAIPVSAPAPPAPTIPPPRLTSPTFATR
jgi:hypothetical protein